MNLYRITATRFAADLSGMGGLYSAGRWHKQGTRILYASEHVSLAKLEVLANSTETPDNVSLITLEIPANATCLTVNVADLPSGWNQLPYHPALGALIDNWIAEQQYWLMRVPSIHSPAEFNYLINPLHPEHNMLKISNVEQHIFDPRLK